VAEGGDEHPQGRRVEQPVGRRPAPGPGQQPAVLHQHAEPVRQALDERREPVGVEEAEVGGHRVDDQTGPLLAAGQQVEQAAEGAQEHHADDRGDQEEDRGRRRAVPVRPRDPEAVGQ